MLLRRFARVICICTTSFALAAGSNAGEGEHRSEANSEAKSDVNSVESIEVEFPVDVQVEGFWIGPNGKTTHMIKAGDKGDEPLAGLPESVRKLLEYPQVIKTGQPLASIWNAEGKIIIVDKHGKQTVKAFGDHREEKSADAREQVLQSLPEEIRKKVRLAITQAEEKVDSKVDYADLDTVNGKFVVVSPNGKKHVFRIGKEGVSEAHGLSIDYPQPRADAQREESKAGDDVGAKLDLILQRLEALEERMNAIGN